MRIVQVGYRKNKSSKTNQYEHEHYECHVQVNEGESEYAAMQLAKDFVDEQFEPGDEKDREIRRLRRAIKELGGQQPAPRAPGKWCQYCGHSSMKLMVLDSFRICSQCRIKNANVSPPKFIAFPKQ